MFSVKVHASLVRLAGYVYERGEGERERGREGQRERGGEGERGSGEAKEAREAREARGHR